MSNIIARPMDKLKTILNEDSVQQQFKNAMKENSGAFVASIIDLYGSDTYLQQCDPKTVVMECLKAATLRLPINKQLGFAWVVPYKSKGQQIPQFQLGYKGYIQLAMRTGQYKYLNAGSVPEGMKIKNNILSGQIEFLGEPTSAKAQGYFAYMELINGFTKTVYMTTEEVLAHAKRYSKSFSRDTSAWQSNFDEMAQKTVIRKLLSHYGFLSTDMATALTSDKEEDAENRVSSEIAHEANQDVVDIEPVAEANSDQPETEQDPPPPEEDISPQNQQQTTGPDF